jgi:hypothetical protein
MTRDGFVVGGHPGAGTAASGVTATIDDAESFQIQKIGGPGKEFWVGGINYDNNGEVAALLQRKKNLEPGSWRVAVSPRATSDTVRFRVELTVSSTYSNVAGN